MRITTHNVAAAIRFSLVEMAQAQDARGILYCREHKRTDWYYGELRKKEDSAHMKLIHLCSLIDPLHLVEVIDDLTAIAKSWKRKHGAFVRFYYRFPVNAIERYIESY